ncbi:MAG: 3-oxoacyl-ACP reductase FabG [Acutalibacteraceae bacterium]|nr:3-oxoacyl-ACP reductase FabG [Acutalibacteraceae bacterium]
MAKTVLITGASRGIGAEIARQFALNGYNVAINYNKSKNQALLLKHEITETGGTAEIFKADVSNHSEVVKMAEAVYSTFGFIDVLVNNAGIAQQILFTDITPEIWANMLNTNLTSVYNCCNAVLPKMISEHKGNIINIASMWGETGGSCEVHYSAAKAGVIGLTKALAKEVGLSGIRVNCVSPGVVMTDMMSDFTEETLDCLKEETPLNKLGNSLDIANAVLFLADEKSSFITGQVLGVNGGILI